MTETTSETSSPPIKKPPMKQIPETQTTTQKKMVPLKSGGDTVRDEVRFFQNKFSKAFLSSAELLLLYKQLHFYLKTVLRPNILIWFE